MYRRILVPIDGSRTAKAGLELACGLAKEQNAAVRVVNVVDDIAASPPMEMYAAQVLARIVEASRREGQVALKAAAALAARLGIDVATVQLEAHGVRVSKVILREAAMWKADLIVMGTHGRRGFQRMILGSDAERVVCEASVPVLLTRAPISDVEQGEVLLDRVGGACAVTHTEPVE